MTPVQKLEAAIAKLEELRLDSTQAPWSVSESVSGDHRWINRRFEFFGIQTEDVARIVGPAEDAELIVTLHRTIDAQLDYLRFARSIAGAQMTGEQYGFVVDFGVEFADAILGGA